MNLRSIALACWVFGTASIAPYQIVDAAPACPLQSSFVQADVDPVWDDVLKKTVSVKSSRDVLFDGQVVVFSEFMAVDADGAARTYSAKDPVANLCDPHDHPENVGKDPAALGCAMDNICEGITMRVPAGKGGFKILDSGSCSQIPDAFRKAMANNWEAPDGTRIESGIGVEMKDADKGVPCIDKDNAYMVSKTVPSGVAGKACEQQKWLNSLVPFIVVPQCWTKVYRTEPKHAQNCAYLKDDTAPDLSAGDLVALLSRTTGDAPIFALIGDAGPNGKLGEASIGLLMKSEGKTAAPTYLKATNWYDRRKKFDVAIFRGTKYTKPVTIESYQEIESAAADKFKKWSGGEETSRALLAACGAKASPGPR
jgi:hypothetical protein